MQEDFKSTLITQHETIYNKGKSLLKSSIKIRESFEAENKQNLEYFYSFEEVLSERNEICESLDETIDQIQSSVSTLRSDFYSKNCLNYGSICNFNLDKKLMYNMVNDYLQKRDLLHKIIYDLSSEQLLDYLAIWDNIL